MKRVMRTISHIIMTGKFKQKGGDMKRSWFLLSVLAALMFFQGCGGTTSKISFFEENFNNDNDALVYVYRLKSIVGGAVGWDVFLDYKAVGVLKQGAYMVLHVTPGQHSIHIGVAKVFEEDLQEWLAQNRNIFWIKEKEIFYVRSNGFSVEYATKEKALAELSSLKFDMGK